MNKIKNPILSGFNPDPSCIQVDGTYYLVTSTFEWFPGVNLYSSKDLKHWKRLPSPLNNSKMLDMKGVQASGGVWAPDISYADNKFWLVFTNVINKNSVFNDLTNYVTTADNISGPWTTPIKLNGIGFDPSLFHDGPKKYLVQQTVDQREYNHPFNGITITEFDSETMKLLPNTERKLFSGTKAGRTEGPHLYHINNYYYLFVAEGGTSFEHQETVARAKSLDDPFEIMPDGPFIGNFDSPDFEIQKQGHGALFNTPSNEWYYVSLMSRPWHHHRDSIYDPRGWSSLGRETALQKVFWDDSNWPRVVGGHNGQLEVPMPSDAQNSPQTEVHHQHDEFDQKELDNSWNTLRIPFTSDMGELKNNQLKLIGHDSLTSYFQTSLIGRRWQDFYFDAETEVQFNPSHYQQMAGLVNFYNGQYWSWIHVTHDEALGRVIQVSEMNGKNYHSILGPNPIQIPNTINSVYFKVSVRKQTYFYAYSFNGKDWTPIDHQFDAKYLSDEYVKDHYNGGFFTGAFVCLAAVDGTGYQTPAYFNYFDYQGLTKGEHHE